MTIKALNDDQRTVLVGFGSVFLFLAVFVCLIMLNSVPGCLVLAGVGIGLTVWATLAPEPGRK